MDLSDNSLIYFQLGNEKSNKKRKTVYGIIIVIGIAISWVGSTQFAKKTYTKSFNAPWFVVWFSTSWMSLCFPVISLILRLFKGYGIRTSFAKAQTIFGERGLCPFTLFTRCLPFALLWCACNYMYTRALSVLSATDVTALFSSAPAFVFVLSLAVLAEEVFSWRRLLATFIAIGGIVVIAYSNGFTGPSTRGVLLAVGSAILAAMYKVSLKRFVGDAEVIQVSLFLSCLGILNLLGFWPIMEIMHFTHYEKIHWSNMPWEFLCGSAALGLLFNFLINFGIAFTFPLFISLGTVLGIPINAGVDAIWWHDTFSALKWVGAVMIIIGFLLMSYRGKNGRSEARPESPQMASAMFVRVNAAE